MAPRTTIAALQSVRGIAALVVLLHHASFVFATSPGFRSASETMFNAHAAVELFFVLSGFVLCRSLDGVALDFSVVWRFWLRRTFRIVPLVWAGCGLMGIVLALLYVVPTPNASAWFGISVPPGQVTGANLLANALMLKRTLVLPLWSIRVEFVMSLLLPLLWALVARGLTLPLLIGAGVLCLMTDGINPLYNHVFAFVLGAGLARYDRLAFPPLAAGAAVLVLLFFRRIDPAWALETGFNAVVPTFVESFAAAIVVGYLAQHRGPKWLGNAWLVALGDVSYSIYVLHFPITVALSKLPVFASMAPDTAALWLMALALAATLPVAFLGYRWIERPGIALGRRWT